MTDHFDDRSIKSLIAELAQLEDQVRAVRHAPPGPAADAPTITPELIALLHRERDIITSLRRRQRIAAR